jgi:hypothetical protein
MMVGWMHGRLFGRVVGRCVGVCHPCRRVGGLNLEVARGHGDIGQEVAHGHGDSGQESRRKIVLVVTIRDAATTITVHSV